MMLGRSLSRPRRQNSHRGDLERRCEPFLKYLRGRACALTTKRDHVCTGKVRACHVDYAGGKGMGVKVADMHAIPMCDGAHEEQHRIGWQSFEAKWNLGALALAAQLWGIWLNSTTMGVTWRRSHEA
jgi:hypothetical protein